MSVLFAAIVGVAIALFGTFPLVWALELGLRHDARATVGRGLAGVLVSFATSSVMLLGAYLMLGPSFRDCGIAFVVAMVVVWSVESVRAYMTL